MIVRLRSLLAAFGITMIMAAGVFGPVPTGHAASAPVSSAVVTVVPSDQQPPTQQPTGRQVTREDWLAHTPLLVACFLLVIVVDAAFVLYIIVKRLNRRQVRRQAAS